ncbi:hypothetical protein [Methylomonas koyamae]|uniref:hypothetical protein n=1 Tax=Methylomonas koyamae TaxID=702114 RepID=UPI003570F29C
MLEFCAGFRQVAFVFRGKFAILQPIDPFEFTARIFRVQGRYLLRVFFGFDFVGIDAGHDFFQIGFGSCQLRFCYRNRELLFGVFLKSKDVASFNLLAQFYFIFAENSRMFECHSANFVGRLDIAYSLYPPWFRSGLIGLKQRAAESNQQSGNQ